MQADAAAGEEESRHHPALLRVLAQTLGVAPTDIVDFDLNVCDTQPGTIGGEPLAQQAADSVPLWDMACLKHAATMPACRLRQRVWICPGILIAPLTSASWQNSCPNRQPRE